jgi:hypothetical protein
MTDLCLEMWKAASLYSVQHLPVLLPVATNGNYGKEVGNAH